MPLRYQPGQKIDHYAILLLLGQGTASFVYQALDRNTGQQVVLKFPQDDVIGGRAIFERYQREAQIGKILCHPYIIQHLNQEEGRQTNYLVLEHLRGQMLRVLIAKYAPALLPIDDIVALLTQVCEALVYAHNHGVIHQDIKPDNIMVLENGEVKVLDFGIAQFKTERKSIFPGFSPLVGTPDYMAPERLQGKLGSERTDIYAVGIVLYELLCGRTPYQEQDGFALVGEHISHDPPDILVFNPSLSPRLATIVMRAVRRDPDKRYEHMEDLLYDLQHVENMTPTAYVPDAPEFGGRYRQIIFIALFILVLIIVLILFGVFAQFVHHAVR